jgi:hypothetical protein
MKPKRRLPIKRKSQAVYIQIRACNHLAREELPMLWNNHCHRGCIDEHYVVKLDPKKHPYAWWRSWLNLGRIEERYFLLWCIKTLPLLKYAEMNRPSFYEIDKRFKEVHYVERNKRNQLIKNIEQKLQKSRRR